MDLIYSDQMVHLLYIRRDNDIRTGCKGENGDPVVRGMLSFQIIAYIRRQNEW